LSDTAGSGNKRNFVIIVDLRMPVTKLSIDAELPFVGVEQTLPAGRKKQSCYIAFIYLRDKY